MIKNKVAIITGGAKGIGYGITEKFCKEGYAVSVVGSSSESSVSEALVNLRKYNNPVIYIQADISDKQGREKILNETLKAYSRVDVLINNAGVAPKERLNILETTEDSFDYVLDINLKGNFFLTQLVANEMIQLKKAYDFINPRIVNISSISAYVSSVNRGEYCISKAGISMITSLFADELAQYGINVNEVRPGIIHSDMTAKVQEKYDKLIFEENLLPIKRWGYPSDVAEATYSLCSDGFLYITGQVINVDGGFHIRRL